MYDRKGIKGKNICTIILNTGKVEKALANMFRKKNWMN